MSDSGAKQQDGKICQCKGDRGWYIVGQTMICNFCKYRIEEEDDEDD